MKRVLFKTSNGGEIVINPEQVAGFQMIRGGSITMILNSGHSVPMDTTGALRTVAQFDAKLDVQSSAPKTLES